MIETGEETTIVNKYEFSLYRAIGIPQFKRVILLLEKIKHLNDGKLNKNYHLKRISTDSIDEYFGFIIYNSCIHGAGLILDILYFIFVFIFGIRIIVLDIILYASILLNIYCLVLQRYVYLKLKECKNRRFLRNERYVAQQSARIIKRKRLRFTNEQVDQDITLIREMQNCLNNHKCCIIYDNYLSSLTRWNGLLIEILPQRQRLTDLPDTPTNETYIAEQFISCISSADPYGKTEEVVDRLRKALFKQKCRSVIDGFSIITESKEVESLYKKVFPTDSYDCVYRNLTILETVYKNMSD